MREIPVIFDQAVDEAITDLIDFVPIVDLPAVIAFIQRIQTTLVKTLSFSPEAGTRFQGNVRMFVVERYVFLYEYRADLDEVHVLDLKLPGQNWR